MTRGSGRRTRVARGRAVIGAITVSALVGCLDIGTGPGQPFAVEFGDLPFPALLSGDTMRDPAGVATPLTLVTYDGNGNEITGLTAEWFVLDTGATIDEDGFLTTNRKDGTVRVAGVVGGLQSPQRIVRVARRPDTLFTAQDTNVAFTYVLPDANSNATPLMAVKLNTTDTVGGLSPGVNGWLVRWRAVHEGDTLAPDDESLVTLWTSGNKASGQDTTPADGTSQRKLRIWANRLPAAIDSFLVVAEAHLHGVPVPGSPVIFKVKVAPPGTP